ncbi:MAG TPA: GNAT family N-acetyltransferase [Sphingomicrobium sp.]|nr:GNAT family N-acetyltransferase [Sphingomicrobium sp.]
MPFDHRLASENDRVVLEQIMDRAIGQLQLDFLSPEQVAASRAFMGIDTQLIRDRTYFIVEENGVAAGCGGWSRRATLYGGDHSKGLREARLLNPVTEPARIRAMYTDPDFTRRGVGSLILKLCEKAAAAEGFTEIEMMATLSGEPLYRAAGYRVTATTADGVGDVSVPLLRMCKKLD